MKRSYILLIITVITIIVLAVIIIPVVMIYLKPSKTPTPPSPTTTPSPPIPTTTSKPIPTTTSKPIPTTTSKPIPTTTSKPPAPTKTSKPPAPTKTSKPPAPTKTSKPPAPTKTSKPPAPTKTSKPKTQTCWTDDNDKKYCLDCLSQSSTIVGVPGDIQSCNINSETGNAHICNDLSLDDDWYTKLYTNWVCSGKGNNQGLYPNNSCSITFVPNSKYTKEQLTQKFVDMCMEHNYKNTDNKWTCDSVKVTDLGNGQWSAELGSAISNFSGVKDNKYTTCGTSKRVDNADLENKLAVEGLQNPLSFPSYLGSLIINPTNIYTNIAKEEMLKINYDLTPFKIVPVSYLIRIGKAIAVPIPDFLGKLNVSDKGCSTFSTRYIFYLMNFLTTDPYLPVGDAISVGQNTLNDIYILLVKNDSKYAYIIPSTLFQPVGTNDGCYSSTIFQPKVNWVASTAYGVSGNNRIFPGGYYVMGDRLSVTGVLNDAYRAFAAVQANYLKLNSPQPGYFDPRLEILWLWGNRGYKAAETPAGEPIDPTCYCNQSNLFTATSPYNTFNITNTNPVTGKPTFNENPLYLYFSDITPK